jgi:hypothetical protein
MCYVSRDEREEKGRRKGKKKKDVVALSHNSLTFVFTRVLLLSESDFSFLPQQKRNKKI